jgi:ABC-type dipeptide/oligopeptide/nickel transport system permease component
MARYALSRIPQLAVALAGVSAVAFILIHLSGDPALLMLPSEASELQIRAFRHEMGFDRALPAQYADFVVRAARGDFGRSLRYHQPALGLVVERMPATASLAVAAMVVAVGAALPLGIVSARRRDSLWDVLATTGALTGQSMPVFWVGIVLILLFADQWHLLPTSGSGSVAHLVLPAVTLGLYSMGRLMRLTRSSVLEVSTQDYVRTARAKGIAERSVLAAHILRNAWLPLLTLIGVEVASLLGGAVITETVFAWPGMGRLVVAAIYTRDYPVVQAAVFIIATIFVVINLLVDLSYAAVDPRVRYQ